MAKIEPTKKIWKNRLYDEKSGPLASQLTMGFGALAVFLEFFTPGYSGWNFLWRIFDGSLILEFLLAVTACFCSVTFLFPLLSFAVLDVPTNQRWAIKFLGKYTGEVAEHGRLMLPIGYSFDVFAMQSRSVVAGPLDIATRDGFPLRAKISSAIRIANIYEYEWIQDELTSSILESALNSAASQSNVAEFIERREQLNKLACKTASTRFDRYGLALDFVSIDLVEVPAYLSELIAVLKELAQKSETASSSSEDQLAANIARTEAGFERVRAVYTKTRSGVLDEGALQTLHSIDLACRDKIQKLVEAHR